MRGHSANEMRYQAAILDTDGATVLVYDVGCNVEDLSGRRLEQAQLSAPETSHMILMRAGDAGLLTDDGYILCDGTTYVVDYQKDPRVPRPGMWVEVFCHVERTQS